MQFWQSGTTLPACECYLEDGAQYQAARARMVDYAAKLFELAC